MTDPETNCSGDNDIPSAAEKERKSSKKWILHPRFPPNQNGLGRWLVYQCRTDKNDVLCLCVLCIFTSYVLCFESWTTTNFFVCVGESRRRRTFALASHLPKSIFVERSSMFLFRHKTFRFLNQKQKNCVVIRGAICFVTFFRCQISYRIYSPKPFDSTFPDCQFFNL